jgi:serine/threonine protein phosphatase PrpC
MTNLQTTIAGLTHPGMLRSRNEDAIAWNESIHLAILADGMGGHNAGDVASSMALEIILSTLQDKLPKVSPPKPHQDRRRMVIDAINVANAQIHQTAINNPEQRGMGATLVLALFYRNWLLAAHIGDSRIYRLRKNRFKALTRDHSLVNQLIADGTLTEEEAETSQYRNVITRALGHSDTVETETRRFITQPGDIYLLCSDGLYDMVADTEIHDIILRHQDNLETATQSLIDTANQNGGADNVSALLIRTNTTNISTEH